MDTVSQGDGHHPISARSGEHARQYSRSFLAVPDAVREARRWAADLMRQDQAAALVAIVELLVSELASNAVQHADTATFTVQVQNSSVVRVAVCDLDGRVPRLHRVGVESHSGRGLALVQDLSDEWGMVRREGGKCLWFQLGRPAT
jgi:anti-sigma regulatory factor (Ser/Thr protein kinase)